MRRVTDKRSPVQAERTRVAPVVVAALVLAGAIWAWHDAWIDPLAVPTPMEPTERVSPRTSGQAPDATPIAPPSLQGVPATGRRSARGNLTSLFSPDDYPADAANREEQGTVQVELGINEEGKVDRCTIRQSSGSQSLDNATCRIIQARARFQPARDADDRPSRDTYTQRITWRLEG